MDKLKNSLKCMNCNSTNLKGGVFFKPAKDRTSITKSIIRHWLFPHVFSDNDIICHNCWNAAERAEEKILSQNNHLTVEEIVNSELTKVAKRPCCLMCGRSILQRHQSNTQRSIQTKPVYFLTPTEEEKNITSIITALIGAHRKIEPDSKLCHACFTKVKRYASEPSGKKKKYDQNKADATIPHPQNNGDAAKSEPDSQSKSVTKNCVTIDSETIELPQYIKISQSADHCIFPECSNQNLQTVSNNLQVRTLKDYDIFIPQNSMICDTHLNSNNWNKLYKDKANVSTFTAEDIEQIFSLVQTKANTDANFKNYMTMDEHTFIYFLGVNRETVNVILKYLPQIEEIDHGVLGLIGLFIKHENGGPNDRIANLLKLPLESSLHNAMKHVKEILVNNPIVTKNMGIEYLLKRHL